MSGRTRIVVDDEMIKEIEVLAGRGLTQQQIAAYFGVCWNTLSDRMKENPEIRLALRRGKSKTISFVAGKLIEQIKQGSTQATIFYLKVQAKWKESDEQSEDSYENEEDNQANKLELNTRDPIEAAKRYQQIMLRGKNERNSTGK